MNIISPLHTKRTIADLPVYEMMTMAGDEKEQETSRLFGVTIGDVDDIDNDDIQPSILDEHTLFLLLERQRIDKLKELYCDRRLRIPGTGQKLHEDAFSLQVPPRYQCLDYSETEGLLSEIQNLKQNQRHHSIPIQENGQWKSELDEATLKYLADLTKALNYRHSTQTRSLTPLPFLPLSSNTITPPSTPLLISLEVLDISPLSLYIHPEGGRNEVDLSDDEILSLWSCALPSDDGVDLEMFQ